MIAMLRIVKSVDSFNYILEVIAKLGLISSSNGQRFFCKHCESSFMAKTPIVDKGCFISNDVKRSIVLNLCETKSMDLIAREL